MSADCGVERSLVFGSAVLIFAAPVSNASMACPLLVIVHTFRECCRPGIVIIVHSAGEVEGWVMSAF